MCSVLILGMAVVVCQPCSDLRGLDIWWWWLVTGQWWVLVHGMGDADLGLCVLILRAALLSTCLCVPAFQNIVVTYGGMLIHDYIFIVYNFIGINIRQVCASFWGDTSC